MAKVWIEESTLINIANAIRRKKGTTELINPSDFATEIDSIYSNESGVEETYEDMLYDHFSINKIDYPYILLTVQFGGSFTHATVYFSPNQHGATDSSFTVAGQSIRARYTPSGDYDWDMKTAVEKIIENATTTESFNSGNAHNSTRESHDIYGNFENEYLDGRLDTQVDSES